MSLVSKTLSGFYNGISQQSPTLRLETQADLQENALGTLVDGLYKRPNTEHITTLNSNAGSGACLHKINRDANEQYLVVVTEDTTDPIEVFTIDGTKCTIRYGQLDEDLTFTADSSVKDYLDIPTGYNPNHVIKLMTISDYTFILNTSIKTAMTTDLTSGTITATVSNVAGLPASPSTGTIYEVSGDGEKGFLSYYVKYDGEVYRECPRPNITYKLDDTTMPHRLVRTDTDEFTFAPIAWGERLVGDAINNPQPSFIDNYINNITFYQNRLVMLSQDNVICSRTGEYYNFWASTAVDVLDDEPIDTSLGAKELIQLRSAIPFEKSLIILSDEKQFSFGSGDENLTPTTKTATPTTSYQTCPLCEPISAGSNVYFVNPRDAYTSIREYLVMPDTLIEDASDVTAHVPNYIPNGFIQMQACNSFDMILVHSDSEPETIFLYKYFWAGNEKPQSAWSKWIFDGDVIAMSIMENTLYLIVKRSSEVSLESIQLENVATDSMGFRIHLDRLAKVQGSYTDGETTWTLPYTDTYDLVIVNPNNGISLNNVTNQSGTSLKVSGDYSDTEYYIGKNYTMKYRLSDWYIRNQEGVAVTEGRLQIRSLTLSFTDTGYFRVEVTPFRRDTLTTILSSEFSGILVGISNIGEVSLMSGEEKFMVLAKNKQTKIEIINDIYLPCALQTGSFEGIYSVRSRAY